MNGETFRSNPSLHAMHKAIGRRLGWWQVGANLIGACTVTSYFVFFDQVFSAIQVQNTVYVVGIMFPVLCVIATGLMFAWQKDLVRFLRLDEQGQEPGDDLRRIARKKILELPLVSAMISLFNWFLAGITMAVHSMIADIKGGESFATELTEGIRVFAGCMIGGIVVAAIIFFITEAKCRQIWPFFFPRGGLARATGVFRLNLRPRMLVIFVLASILPLILMGVLSYNKARMMLVMNPEVVIQSLLYLTAFLLTVILAVALILSRQFSTGIIDPVKKMEDAMVRVESGDLTASVTVERNDELGVLAENFNRMTDGLRDRYRLRQALDLAKEVQQSLLPKTNPTFAGLDISGTSIYCDETGGDYFDFFRNDAAGARDYSVVIADVSEHGIPSALLMASTRAFLRQRASLAGGIASVVTDVNRQLTRDVDDSGRFITLFFLQVNMDRRTLNWVRAGHDPAVLYDPVSDQFEELGGKGIALGLDSSWQYESQSYIGLTRGQIIVMSTDGIWEARNPQDQMFGKEALHRIIQRHAHKSAAEIQETILSELRRFQQNLMPADDITLVVIKVEKEA
jgi:sigma-B regulation protein RsbU (phosphoserine phosphatase)